MKTPVGMRILAPALGVLVVASWVPDPRASEPEPKTPQNEPSSVTSLGGPSNPLLANGAAALEAGHIEEGLRLTLEGLKIASPIRDEAAGHANACAGFALLKQWDEALIHCDEAIRLDDSNWRAYNNRAAVYTGKGLYDLAIRDLQTGLAIAPQSRTLHLSLEIAEKNKRIMSRPGHREVPS